MLPATILTTLTTLAAVRLALAAVIPRYSPPSTLDETISQAAPTISETNTLIVTETSFKKLTMAPPTATPTRPQQQEQANPQAKITPPPKLTDRAPDWRDNLDKALSRAREAAAAGKQKGKEGSQKGQSAAAPASRRMVNNWSPPADFQGQIMFGALMYSPPELGIHPPQAEITPAPKLTARASDWRADVDKALSRAREAAAAGKQQGKEGAQQGQSEFAAAAASRRMANNNNWDDRPANWQEQISSAMSLASSALAYGSSIASSASAATTVTVTVDGSRRYNDDNDDDDYHHRYQSSGTTVVVTSTAGTGTSVNPSATGNADEPTITFNCGDPASTEASERQASGVSGQSSNLARSVFSGLALLALAGGIQIL
ncbi:hypothetical protein B0I37DRAFT_379800 [Chaetomium sp. MPI-CAGE-AT-0009]|nr:hypothetical protein B0I37DRAFT_379800 [Chaetomium sp. MPI-CAGE-AT-0009]